MRKWGRTFVFAGAVLLGFYLISDEMDEETALARYGHRDGRSATVSEILDARESWSPTELSGVIPWSGVGLIVVGSFFLFVTRPKR